MIWIRLCRAILGREESAFPEAIEHRPKRAPRIEAIVAEPPTQTAICPPALAL